jgi:hypothetical protein
MNEYDILTMYPHSHYTYNSTQSSDGVPTSSDPLTALAVLVVFGSLVLILAISFRWCLPETFGGAAAEATDERHERQRRRLDYIHKVLKTHPWHGTGVDISTKKERDAKDDKAPDTSRATNNAAPTSTVTDSLTIPSGECDDIISSQGTSAQGASRRIPLDGEADEAAPPLPRESLDDMTGPTDERLHGGGSLAVLSSFASGDGGGAPECAICLSRFAEGEVVCESNNPHCHHAYHRDCLEPWLLRHERCPICREVYLGRPPASRAPEGRRSSGAAIAVVADSRPAASTFTASSENHRRFRLH